MISCINCSQETSSLLSENKKGVSGFFLSWVSTEKDHKADKLLLQTESVKKIIRDKIRTVIFDSNFSLAPDEVSYFSNHRFIHLTEPALITRRYFTYLPHWTKIRNIDDIALNEKEKPIHLLYKGKISDRIKSFEKYYLDIKTYWPDFRVAYNSNDLIQKKEKEYASLGIEKTNLGYESAQNTIIIGSTEDYYRGHLDPYIFDAVRNNCIPSIATEHRFFRSLSDTDKCYLNMYNNVYIGELISFYRNIEESYYEMTDVSFKNTVYNLLGG